MAFGVAEADHQVAALVVVAVAGRVEGLAIPAHGVVGCEGGDGLVTGLDRVADGLVEVGGSGGGEPVGGELTDPAAGVVAGEGFDGLGDLAVQADTPAGRQVLVEGVLHQRVREREPVGHARHFAHQTSRHRGFQDVDHGVGIEIDRAGHDGGVEVAADDRGRAEHPMRGLAEAPHAGADDLTDALGQTGRFEIRRSRPSGRRPVGR